MKGIVLIDPTSSPSSYLIKDMIIIIEDQFQPSAIVIKHSKNSKTFFSSFLKLVRHTILTHILFPSPLPAPPPPVSQFK
jgi:hypothetical protein